MQAKLQSCNNTIYWVQGRVNPANRKTKIQFLKQYSLKKIMLHCKVYVFNVIKIKVPNLESNIKIYGLHYVKKLYSKCFFNICCIKNVVRYMCIYSPYYVIQTGDTNCLSLWPVVLKKKIKMWKVNGRQTADAGCQMMRKAHVSLWFWSA
jgi:hypothetical protein